MTNETRLTERFDAITNQRVYNMQLDNREALLAAVIIENVKPSRALINVINEIDLAIEDLAEITKMDIPDDAKSKVARIELVIRHIMGELDSLL